MKALVWTVAVWIAVFTFAPVTQAADFKTADAELNRVYQQVVKKYADEPAFINKFKQAQRAWLKFRDAHLESRYPAEDKRDYGSIYSLCSSNLLAELTQARTEQLKLWLEGIEEGDGCAGSVRTPGALK